MLRYLQNKKNVKMTGALVLFIFVGTLFFSLLNMSYDMDTMGNSQSCAFMGYGETVCSMNVFDHFEIWESTFMAVVPTFTFLLIVMAAMLIVMTVAPNLLLQSNLLYKHTLVKNNFNQVPRHPIRPLQELFSQGILHPKLF